MLARLIKLLIAAWKRGVVRAGRGREGKRTTPTPSFYIYDFLSLYCFITVCVFTDLCVYVCVCLNLSVHMCLVHECVYVYVCVSLVPECGYICIHVSVLRAAAAARWLVH